jgi:hypothetical protein
MSSPDVLPAGNEWSFQESNFLVRPSDQLNEIRRPSGLLKNIVTGLQVVFVADGWQFASVIGNERSLITVFTHPNRTENLVKPKSFSSYYSIENFIRPETWAQDDRFSNPPLNCNLPEDAVDQILKGSNLVCDASRPFATYNSIRLPQTDRYPKLLHQIGVGIIMISMSSIDDLMFQAEEKIKELEEARDFLNQKRVYNPEQLFPGLGY